MSKMNTIVEYLWLDVNNHLRSKQKTVMMDINDLHTLREIIDTELKKKVLKNIPLWSFDGSSTGQADIKNSELLLKPVNIITHPKYNYKTDKIPKFLVLCEVFYDEVTPHETNHRAICKSIYVNRKDIFNKDAWFGLEQEFFFFDKLTKRPYMWSEKKNLNPEQGEYYCGINRCFPKERIIMDTLYNTCLRLGIPISGINQEVAPSQWEYQIGPCQAPYIADYMIFVKYILFSLCEEQNLYAVFNPKPIKGDWNGSGCHINFSTNETRSIFETEIYKSKRSDTENNDISLNITTPALVKINNIISSMKEEHSVFIELLGERNKERLSGICETETFDKFSYGIGTRNTSIRIPIQTQKNGFGYIEDRRPGSNIDYYSVISEYAKYI